MSQTKLMSFIESLANTAVGIMIAYFAQLWFFEQAGIAVTAEQNTTLVLFMTVVSILRSYVLRRVFNKHTDSSASVKVVPVRACDPYCRGNRAKFDEESV